MNKLTLSASFIVLLSCISYSQQVQPSTSKGRSISCIDDIALVNHPSQDERHLIHFCLWYLSADESFYVTGSGPYTVNIAGRPHEINQLEIDTIQKLVRIPMLNCRDKANLERDILLVLAIMSKFVKASGDYLSKEDDIELPSTPGSKIKQTIKDARHYDQIDWAYLDLRNGLDITKLPLFLGITRNCRLISVDDFKTADAIGIVPNSDNCEVLSSESSMVYGIIGQTDEPQKKNEILVFDPNAKDSNPGYKISKE